jgi:hypothetical protein
VVPVLAAVVRYEARRRRKLAPAAFTPLVLAGGLALFAGLGVSLTLGAMPGAVIGVVAVLAASRLLRAQKTRHLGR